MVATEAELTTLRNHHRDHLAGSLRNLRRNRTMCDIQLRCGSSTFPAHRCVLMAASSYFFDAFTGPHFHDTDTVNLPVDGGIMENVLDFLYTGDIAIDNNTLPSVLLVANLLQVTELYELCLTKSKSCMDPQNFTRLWKVAEKCGDDSLKAEVTKYCCGNVDRLIKNGIISRCSPTL